MNEEGRILCIGEQESSLDRNTLEADINVKLIWWMFVEMPLDEIAERDLYIYKGYNLSALFGDIEMKITPRIRLDAREEGHRGAAKFVIAYGEVL